MSQGLQWKQNPLFRRLLFILRRSIRRAFDILTGDGPDKAERQQEESHREDQRKGPLGKANAGGAGLCVGLDELHHLNDTAAANKRADPGPQKIAHSGDHRLNFRRQLAGKQVNLGVAGIQRHISAGQKDHRVNG